jgi:tetratricopeptide (TPR) repeat protein
VQSCIPIPNAPKERQGHGLIQVHSSKDLAKKADTPQPVTEAQSKEASTKKETAMRSSVSITNYPWEKISPSLAEQMKKASPETLLQAVLLLHGFEPNQRPPVPSLRDYPTKQDYKRAIHERQINYAKSIAEPVVEKLQRLPLRIFCGTEIFGTIDIEGTAEAIQQAAAFPEIKRVKPNVQIPLSAEQEELEEHPSEDLPEKIVEPTLSFTAFMEKISSLAQTGDIQAAIRLWSHHRHDWKENSQEYADFLIYGARLYKEEKKHDEAYNILLECLSHAQSIEDKHLLYKIHFFISQNLREQGKLEQSILHLQEAYRLATFLSLNKERCQFLTEEGETYLQMGERQIASEKWNQASELAKQSFFLEGELVARGNLIKLLSYGDEADWRTAIDAYKQLEKDAKKYRYVEIEKASKKNRLSILLRLSELDAAVNLLEEMEREASHHKEINLLRLERADLYGHMKQHKKALILYKTIETDSLPPEKNIRFLNNRSICFFQIGQENDAISSTRKAILLAQQHSYLELEANATANLAMFLLNRYSPEGEVVLARAISLAEQIGSQALLAYVYSLRDGQHQVLEEWLQ